MRNRATWYFAALVLLIVAVFSFSGCSRLFGPSDQDVIKAVSESEVFTHGFTLQPPVVIVNKGDRDKKGEWPVTVKIKFSYETTKGHMTTMEQTLVFKMQKSKDKAGNTLWKATLGK
jgi:hypothetical protein